ncbi:hypothetical protein MRB53_040637 [Persea americana]|nr:hypothetical protein MRB53_040637 [Persea americana]
MIKSVDKLTIDPHHLGRCEAFDVKTYVHDSVKKSYIVLSGCQPDLGCTIVLRGGDISTLRTMKRITEFMCYVVYNLKLENYLMRDEFISIPAESQAQLISITTPGGYEPASNVDTEKLHDQQYSDYARTEQEAHSRILSASPFVAFMQPYLLTQLRDTEQKLARFKSLRDTYAAADEEGDTDQEKPIQHQFSVVRPDMVDMQPSKEQPKAVREYLHAVHSAQFDRALATYETQKKLWQAFIANGANPFDPFSHQTIVVLHSIVSSITSAPCVGPELLGIGFYSGYNRADVGFEEDCTLGQYVEDIVIASKTACKECDRPMSDHHRQYVHGYGQMTISVQPHPSRMSGMSNIILMWSRCRLCAAETTVVPMSDNTWKYSFAKYLELAFWSRPMHPRAGVCEHDINKDFLRCFGYQEQVVKVQYDPIDLYDVVVPRPTVLWKVEADLNVKNEQYQLFESRLNAFVDSIKKRLSTINVDTLDEKQMTEAQSTLDALHKRADDDRKELLDKLQAKYSTSRYYELIPLNRALRFMDEKALSWDDTFSSFETDYFPSETDIRKLAAAQLKEMFYGSQQSTDSIVSENSDNEGGSELTTFRPKSLGQKVADGEISDEKAHGMLASVAQEHRSSTLVEGESTANGDSAESLLSQRLSPTEDHQSAVQQETVKHLDLAVASTSPDKHNEGVAAHASQNTNSDAQLANTSQLSEDPATSGLLQRVEQIRNDKPAELKPMHNRESKLRRPNNFGRLTEGSPTLLRAQSQPSSIARLTRDNTDNSERNVSVEPNLDSPPLERRLNDRLIRLGSRLGNLPPSLIPRSIPPRTENGSTSTVSALAKHFEHLSREFERERLRERRLRAAKSRQARANPLASSRPTVEVYRNATDAVVERRTESPAVRNRTTQRILGLDHAAGQAEKNTREVPKEDPPASQQMLAASQQEVDKEMNATDTEVETDMSDTENAQALSQDSTEVMISDLSGSTLLSPSAQDIELHPELSIPEHKRNIWLKVLAEFWSKRSASGWSSLDYPLHSDEHVFEDSDIIVREDEPSSVIALSLASNDYLNKAKEFRSAMAKTSKTGTVDVDVDAQETSIEASLLSDTGTHMKYSFSHGAVKASCKIFYAEAFDALRRRTGVSSRFVESLSRCMKFDSKGGKTKSLFLKSLDNRFIIKSLQEVEVKAFTKFAPDYFAFMSHTLFRGVPSVIAKMFGLFQVSIKNPSSGMDFNYYLLVMENLFYDHTPNRRFDLKGSMRNRKIESTGQPDEVLLDENLVETIFESPLFVREHSRKLLQASVWNDTLWLCKQNVMDYSLMAGFEDDTRQLVVGIIDCIRTYTWDKKLESWIKDRGKNKPTITSPKDYRNRFRVSMMQYVLQAPNCWHQFQASMAPLKTLREKDDLTAPEELAAEKSEITMR